VQADEIRGASASDAFRGLHLGADDVARDLSREPCAPAYRVALDPLHAALASESRLGDLAARFRLDPFERACLLLVLAPDVDPRYERIYAYLQDDVTRKRPTAALALDLFCADTAERLRCSHVFAPDATLLRERLIEAGPNGAGRLSAPLALEPQVLRHVLEGSSTGTQLFSWCALEPVHGATRPVAISDTEFGALKRLAVRALKRGEPFVVHLAGPHGTGKWALARALASALRRPLLTIDLRGALQSGDFGAAIRLTLRTALIEGAIVFLHGYDALSEGGERQGLRALAGALAATPAIVLIGSVRMRPEAAHTDPPVLTIALDRDDRDARRAAWALAARRHEIALPAEALAMLADRFRLTPAQIDAAVSVACRERDWRAEQRRTRSTPGDLTAGDLTLAARAQCGHALALLARRIAPRRRWNDLVLPAESVAMLREICERVVHRTCVLERWGFDAQLSLGKGVTALFAGPSGTGKTLAAEIVAADLGLDLFQIDLANIVSKYIGETEKNLDRVFDAARHANAVLLFDEAEALFGKRSEVRDAHDRYANLEVAYLLQKMEAFDGLAILSTNMRQNIDDAFTRRLAFTVHFPFP
jgi:hypothetical protein